MKLLFIRKLVFVPLLFFFHIPTAKGQYQGYDSNWHEITIEVIEPIIQQIYQAEYRINFIEHFHIVGRTSYQQYQDKIADNDWFYNSVKNINETGHIRTETFIYGGGIAFGYRFKNKIRPKRYFASLTYERVESKIHDKYGSISEPFSYQNNGNLVRIDFRKSYNFHKRFFASIGATFGLYFGEIDLLSNDKQPDKQAYQHKSITSPPVAPRYIYPKSLPRANLTVDGGRPNDNKKYLYYNFYITPTIKVGYLF